MEGMSDHTGLFRSHQLLITAACTNTGGKMKGSHSRADRCPFVPRHSLSRVTSFMQLGTLYHGSNMGPTWVLSAFDGPMLAPWTLRSEIYFKFRFVIRVTMGNIISHPDDILHWLQLIRIRYHLQPSHPDDLFKLRYVIPMTWSALICNPDDILQWP